MEDATRSPEPMDEAPSALRPLDLRVARIEEARDHPDADRLVVLHIEMGGEERQLVAGIKGYYELTELEGMHIVVVANLAPAKLRGEKSEGMLLAAEQGDTLGLLLAPAAPPGTPLRTASGGEPGPEKISIEEFFAHAIEADEDAVTLDGEPLDGADLMVDRGLRGRLK